MSVRSVAGASISFALIGFCTVSGVAAQDDRGSAWEPVDFTQTVLTPTEEDPSGLYSQGEVQEAAAGAGRVTLLASEIDTERGVLTLSILTGDACGMQDCYVKAALDEPGGQRVSTQFGEAICQDFDTVEIDRNDLTLKACGVEVDLASALAGQ